MTAIALTEDKEKNEQQLFDNEYGKASIQYQIKENHVDWQINIHKMTTRHTLDLFATRCKR